MSEQRFRQLARMGRRAFLGTVGAGLAVAGTAGRGTGARSAGRAQQRPTGIPSTLPSAIEIDEENLVVTLPLFRGRGPAGGAVYYVLTEASRIEFANGLGLNWAPKLANALGTPAVQTVRVGDSGPFNPHNPNARFEGTVDFGPERQVAPGPEGFPLDAENSQPGAVGDEAYSPFVATANGSVVFNAPHVANDTGEHDGLVGMDREAMTATLRLVQGFYEDRAIHYITTDAYPADVAALEGGTFADTLSAAPAAGDRDLESSAREAIFPVVDGPMGADNPERQGLRSAVAGEGGPLNVTRSEQVCADPRDPTDCSLFYSPLWDVHPVAWTVAEADRVRLTDHEAIIDRVLAGELESAADGPVNTLLGNVRAAVAAVNCPVITAERAADGADGDGS